MACAAGLPTYEIEGQSWRGGGKRLERSERAAAKASAALARLRRGSADQSLTQALAALRVSPGARAAAAAFVEGFDLAPPDETSAHWVADAHAESVAGGPFSALRFACGYDGVVGWLRAGLGDRPGVVRTGVVAREVEWRPGSVRVRCTSAAGTALEPFECKALVVTLPVGVLQSPPDAPAAVRFDPPLPARPSRALASLGMGAVLRLTLVFREAFWPPRMSFLRAPNEAVPTWWTGHPFLEARLVGWAGGRLAHALLSLGKERIVDHAVGCLARALRLPRARIDRELSSFWMHDWSADPFARGAYAFVRVGGAGAARVLASPVDKTLVFAGEAVCDAPRAGTVHGAIASGRRAARAVLKAHRRR